MFKVIVHTNGKDDDKLRIQTFREQGLVQKPSSPVTLIIKGGN